MGWVASVATSYPLSFKPRACTPIFYYLHGCRQDFSSGVQFVEILLTTPTLKKTCPFIRKLRGTVLNMRVFFLYCSLQKSS